MKISTGCAFVLFFACQAFPLDTEKTLGLENVENIIITSTVNGLGIALIDTAITLPFELISNNAFSQQISNEYFSVLIMTLIPGMILEEIEFRLLLQNLLFYLSTYFLSMMGFEEKNSELLSNYSSNFITSILFGLAHLIAKNPSYYQASQASIKSIYFGYLYINSGLIPVIICHTVHNIVIILRSKYLKF